MATRAGRETFSRTCVSQSPHSANRTGPTKKSCRSTYCPIRKRSAIAENRVVQAARDARALAGLDGEGGAPNAKPTKTSTTPQTTIRRQGPHRERKKRRK